jgi:hypothetical protein
MGTTREEIREWLQRGKEQGATRMLVVCDTFDHEDYPVYVLPGKNAREVYAEYNGKEMQRVIEAYSYELPLDSQLAEHRSFHLG